MQHLIKKEIILQKKMLWFGVFYSIFLFFVFADPIFKEFTYSMAAFGISYITIIGIAQSEYKNNSDIIVNSLPTTRKEVVASKYLSLLTCIVMALIIVGVIGLVFHQLPSPLNNRLIKLSDITITVVSAMVLAAFSLPFYFKTGAQWLRIFNIIIFLIIFFAPVQIASYLVNNNQVYWVQNLTQATRDQSLMVLLISLSALLLVYLISYFISLRIYMNKDF